MINFDNATGANRKKHNPIWSQILDHPYIILMMGDSG